MSRDFRSNSRDFHRIPIGFKLWFGFVGTLALAIFAAMGFFFYTVVTNPEAIGNHVGRMVGGVVEGFKEKSPSP